MLKPTSQYCSSNLFNNLPELAWMGCESSRHCTCQAVNRLPVFKSLPVMKMMWNAYVLLWNGPQFQEVSMPDSLGLSHLLTLVTHPVKELTVPAHLGIMPKQLDRRTSLTVLHDPATFCSSNLGTFSDLGTQSHDCSKTSTVKCIHSSIFIPYTVNSRACKRIQNLTGHENLVLCPLIVLPVWLLV